MDRTAALIWTAPAIDDLDDIAAFIALENETAASALVNETLQAVERLRRFPDSGRRVPELAGKIYRELIVPPCRIIYRREKAKILIVHVVRGERSLRAEKLK